MRRLQQIAYLSHVEHVETVRMLPFPRRLKYTLISAGSVVIALVALVAVSIGIAFVIAPVIMWEPNNMGDRFLLVASIACAYLILLGFSGNPVPREILPGDNPASCVRRAFCSGMIFGLVTGFVIGMIWMFTIRISGLYVQLNTLYGTRVYFLDFVRYGVIVVLSTAAAFALFRALFSVIGHLALGLVRPTESSQATT